MSVITKRHKNETNINIYYNQKNIRLVFLIFSNKRNISIPMHHNSVIIIYDNGYELIMNKDMHEYEVQLRMKGMQVGIGNTDCICQQKSRLCNTI